MRLPITTAWNLIFTLLLCLALAPGLLQAANETDYLAKAENAFRAGDLRIAERSYKMSLRDNPDQEAAVAGLMEIYIAQHRYREAIRFSEVFLATHASAPVYSKRGLAFLRMKDMEAARATFQQAANLGANDPQVLFETSSFFFNHGEAAKGEALSERRRVLLSGEQ